MSVMHTIKPSFNRRALAIQAIQAVTATRAKAQLEHYPIRHGHILQH